MAAKRLRDHQAEIEEAVLERVADVSVDAELSDPDYAKGLRDAVAVAVDYGIEAMESQSGPAAPVPASLLAQARSAARNGFTLDRVLRRYFAGYAVLRDFLVDDSDPGHAEGKPSLKRDLRIQGRIFDHVISAVSQEYRDHANVGRPSAERRLTDLVRRLLDGDSLAASEFAYEFAGWNLAAICSGDRPADAVRELATRLNRQALILERTEQTVWAWFGGRTRLTSDELSRAVATGSMEDLSIAVGEPGRGLQGWRTSFREASAAHFIATREPGEILQYRNVALLASIADDDLLVRSLQETYLAPLEEARDGGDVLKKTVRAYLGAGRNVSSAAAYLNVNRHTVTKRLRVVEELVGRSIDVCATELDAALRLDTLGIPSPAMVRPHRVKRVSGSV
jgi:hypothetical protein